MAEDYTGTSQPSAALFHGFRRARLHDFKLHNHGRIIMTEIARAPSHMTSRLRFRVHTQSAAIILRITDTFGLQPI